MPELNKNNLTIKVTLDKVYQIENNKFIDKDNIYKTDMKWAKDLIKDAQLATCHACNKSSEMWLAHWRGIYDEAELSFENMDEAEKQKIINDKYNKAVKKISADKLQNENYMKTVRKNCIEEVKDKYVKQMVPTIVARIDNENGKTYDCIIQGTTKLIMHDYNSANVGAADRAMVKPQFKNIKLLKIINNESLAPQFKKDIPYCLHNKSYVLAKENNYYYVYLSIFSKNGYKVSNLKEKTRLKFRIGNLDGSKRATLDKIIDKRYKQGAAQIRLVKNKIEFAIATEFYTETDKSLDPAKTLGIDLGISKVAVMSIYNENLKGNDKFEKLSWNERVVDGGELRALRCKIYNMKRALCASSKIRGQGATGHGYTKRMEKANAARDKEARSCETYNHKLSAYIVDFAFKHHCATIQMENLSGVTKEVTENRMLKSWSYYQLQEFITYKAKKYGIAVKFIEPKYTSKRCSFCGRIHVDNRHGDVNQAKFKCVLCGHEENADVNASKNISVPDIDTIIANTEIEGLSEKEEA